MADEHYPKRKNPRLPGFNYSENYYYFITICTAKKKLLFGEPNRLNSFGIIAQQTVLQIPKHFPAVRVDQFVVMPNHVHLILAPEDSKVPITTVVGLYKAHVTRQIHRISPEIEVWQASFHDHIIRNRRSYEKIWEYIDNNPAKWMEDCFYPQSAT